MMKKTSFADTCILSAIKFGRFLVKILPFPVCRAVAKFVGTVVYYTSRRSRIAYKNLRMVYAGEKSEKEMKRIALKSIQNIAITGMEMLRIADMSDQTVSRDFSIIGEEKFRQSIADKKGMIFLTGHFGNWELLNIFTGLRGYPIVVLARAQKHPKSDGYLNSIRSSKGSEVVHKGMAVREILRALKLGKIVAFLSDQDGGRNGAFVNFMGRLSSTPSGVATFALRTKAPIYPAFIFREGKLKHRIEVGDAFTMPPSDWPEEKAEAYILQQFCDALEKSIRSEPEQWLWAHRRWKSSPDKKVLILSDAKAGHLNQSKAIYEAMIRERKEHFQDETRLSCQIIDVIYRNANRSKALSILQIIFGGRLPFAQVFMKWALSPDSYSKLLNTYCDVVISCGSSLQGVNVWIKKLNIAKSVIVMKPSLSYDHFDAIVAPKHDHLEAHPSVFSTEGALASLSIEDLEVEAATLSAELGLSGKCTRLGVLIGGEVAGQEFEKSVFESYLRSIVQFCEHNNIQCFVTTSRRTPAWAEKILKENLVNTKICKLLVIANESNKKNIVTAILGLSDIVAVTSDSVSMISEAVYSGKPVLVFQPWLGFYKKKKYDVYLGRLIEKGFLRKATAENFLDQLESAADGRWVSNDSFRVTEEAVLANVAKKVLS